MCIRDSFRQKRQEVQRVQTAVPDVLQRSLEIRQEQLQRAGMRLNLLDPTLVLQRGYAWLTSSDGVALSLIHI